MFIQFFVAFILLMKCLSVNGNDERIQVRLSGGIIEGRVVRFGDREALAFMGVPFADPPVGDLRFKPTRSKSSWNGIWDATRYGPPCAQRTSTTIQPLANSSEDCLHINIFADRRCLSKSCPIIYYVHGGGFYFDAPTMFNETLLMQNFATHEVIFVMPAYRLGIFGFLDMGDSEDHLNAPQNAALLDLIMALRWCQQELPRLGGDPEQITLVGNSAGSHLAFILLQSPMIEKAAFKRAIMSSGMIGIREGQCRRLSQEVLEQVGCTHNSTQPTFTREQKIECLREKSSDELLDAMSASEKRWLEFSPQVDGRILVDKSVDEFWRNWRGLPLMLITTEEEFFMNNHPDVEGKCEQLVENFGYSSHQSIDRCIDYYTKKSHLNFTVRDAYHAFMHKLASINTQLGFETFAGLFAQTNGKIHAGDLKYLLGLHPLAEEEKDVDDLKMERFYPMLWREFAKNGPQGIKAADWKPTDSQGRNYFWLRFKTNQQTGKMEDWPRMLNGEIVRPIETRFWTEELKRIDTLKINDEDEEDEDGPPSVWLAFWLVLSVCVMLAAALSVIVILCITIKLNSLGLVVRKVEQHDV